ncbi:hypothetical protein PT273_03800 [Orbaceae bacterium ESL0727]|nr:hypothetical protein [Orbaceae bacterium ESL0727]
MSIFVLSFPTLAIISSITMNTIQGTPPYLTFDNGISKVMTTDDLLTIMLSNNARYSRDNNNSSETNPIELPVVAQTFADIIMPVPVTAISNSITMNELIAEPYNYGRDDNGDAITATGTVSVTISDVEGNIITDRKTVLDPCQAPYKITLSNTTSTLSTAYGDPNSTTYIAANMSYFVKPKSTGPLACYLQPVVPELPVVPGASSVVISEYKMIMSSFLPLIGNGFPNQWRAGKGFLPQDISTPSVNWPTTGANMLTFDLTIMGAAASSLHYTKSPTTSNSSLNITEVNSKVAKIEFVLKEFTAAVPTTFTILSDGTPIYRFKISKWFRTDPHNAYCGSGTRVPSMIELTNARHYLVDGNSSTTQDAVAWWQIGGGLFAEWGSTALNFGDLDPSRLNSISMLPMEEGYVTEQQGDHRYSVNAIGNVYELPKEEQPGSNRPINDCVIP